MFVPIYPTQRRHNSEDCGHQTHHPEELKYRNQSKEQNRWCIRVKLPCHMTTACWLSLTASLLRSQKNENCLTSIGCGTTNNRTPYNLNFEDGLIIQNDVLCYVFKEINPLTPNDPYRARTAPLTSKRCILYT